MSDDLIEVNFVDERIDVTISDTGERGLPGKSLYVTGSDPTAPDGAVGEIWINNLTWNVFKKTDATTWTLQGNIKGAQGIQGPQGDQGEQGEQGDPGDQGPQGDPGANGKTWHRVIGAPGSGVGVQGDFAIDDSGTGNWYEKTGPAIWSLRGSLKGPQGTQGIQGAPGNDGNDGAPGAPGVDGDSAYEVAVANGFVGTEAEWLDSLVGPAGPAGNDGADGLDGADGAPGAPGADGEPLNPRGAWDSGATYNRLDLVSYQGSSWVALQTNTNSAPVEGADWTLNASKGEQGDPGPQGDPGADGSDGVVGSLWHVGFGVPENSLGVDNDDYLNLANGDVYQKQTGAWVIVGNIKGPPGTDGQDATASGTYLLSGGTIAWVSGYTYRVGAASYFINGTQYTSPEQDITLDAADGSNDRIDVIAFNAAGPTKITGTPGANPSEPTIDPSTYLRRTIVYVAAASTEPDITVTSIYAENAEWTGSVSAGSIDLNSTDSPRSGSKLIKGTNVAAGAYAEFTTSAFDVTTKNNLVLYVQPTAAWASKKALRVTWFNGSTQKGNSVTIGNGSFGFNSQVTAGYQQIVVPISQFALPSGTAVTKVRVEVTGAGSNVGFRMDDVQLQAGLNTVDLSDIVRWRGNWASTTAYNKNDVVYHSGSSYIALQASTGQNPSTAGTYWTVFAAAGADGGASSDVFSYYDPDKPADTPNAQDDDYDNSGTSLGTAINLGTATYDVDTTVEGALYVSCPQSHSGLRGWLKALPVGDFVRWTKVRMATQHANYQFAGLMFSSINNPAGAGNQCAAYLVSDGGYPTFYVQRGATTGFTSLGTTVSGPTYVYDNEIYIRVRRSGTTLYFTWSVDGKTWRPEISVTEATIGATMAYWGPVFQNSHGSTPFIASWEFVRCIDGSASANLGGNRLIGVAAPAPRGTWSVGTSYAANDMVSYNGNSYIAVAASVGVTPGTDATKWMLFAEKGPPGDATNGFTVDIDGGGTTIQVGQRRRVRVPYGCTVTGWQINSPDSGSIVVDVRKASYNGAFSSIAGTEKPTLTAATWNQDVSLSTWSGGGVLTEGEWLEIYVESVSGIYFASIGFALERAP